MSDLWCLSELQEAIAADPDRWRPLVLTNGCFDLLQVGHARYLQAAKSFGRSLIVGLNSDQSVTAIKPHQPGLPARPIVPALQRAEILAALKSVDGVTIFHQTTATELIAALQPNIYVKGGDWNLQTLPEASVIQALGVQTEFIKVEIPTSTTALINRILHSMGREF